MEFYAIAVGRSTGLFTTWGKCQEYILGYSRASFQKFSTLTPAVQYLCNHGLQIPDIRIDGEISLIEFCHHHGLDIPSTQEIEHMYTLSDTLRVEACHYLDKPRVDIREWTRAGEGRGPAKRTKTGLSLSLIQWKTLMSLEEVIKADFQRIRDGDQTVRTYIHLGNLCYASLLANNPALIIRRWYRSQATGALEPSQKGITLQEGHVKTLFTLKEQVELAHPTLSTLEPYRDNN
jgi:hypothetical protein